MRWSWRRSHELVGSVAVYVSLPWGRRSFRGGVQTTSPHVRNTLGLVASTVNDIPLETHRDFITHIFDGTQGRDIQ